MATDKNKQGTDPNKNNNNPAENAKKNAENDILQDPDLNFHSKNDDLDEGELARLGEDTPGIV